MNDWARLATVRRCLGAFAGTYGDREKVVFPDADPTVRWSAAEFVRETNRVAAGLLGLGLEPGDRVGLVGLNTPELVTAFYGACSVGVVPCCFNPRESAGRLATLGSRLGPAAVVYDPRLAEVAEAVTRDSEPSWLVELPGDSTEGGVEPTHSFEAAVTAGETADSAAGEPPSAAVERDDPAFVNWSTGTTGVPKGLEWTNDGAVAAGVINVHARGLTHEDVRINYSPPGFIGWFYATFPAVVAGATLVFMERFDPERYLELIERERATEFGGVSTPVRMALDAGPEAYDLSSVRSAYYVGELMSRETIERIQAIVTPNVAGLYGTTEATGLTALGSGSDDPTGLSDHLPLVEARAVEIGDGEPVPPDRTVPVGETGELIIRTPGRAARVIGDPELTERTFRDGWWYSGDVVERRADGTFRIVGRTDDMIITGGINVFPSRVEAVIADHPAVEDVVVLGLPDDRWGQRVVAVVSSSPGQTVDADVLDAHCLADDRLPRHARPREYFPLDDGDAFPTTPTGKIHRAELADRLAGRVGDRPTG